MSRLLENKYLERLVGDLPRHPRQLNEFLEGDAELLELGKGFVLAVSVDTIVEEIETGLYQDPYLIGWMTVVASLSDLAAVGARPLGLVLIQHLPQELSNEFVRRLQEGVTCACRAADTYILGGDTNHSQSLQTGATSVGLIEDERLILRKGAQKDDRLYVSGRLGTGNAFAFARFFSASSGSIPDFKPVPRLREGVLVRRYGTACIDTSDGFFSAVANLLDINQKGFELTGTLESLLPGELIKLAETSGVPAWNFLAGPHGEYELLFTVAADMEDAFLNDALVLGWNPLRVGKVTGDVGFSFLKDSLRKSIDPFRIANLFEEFGESPAGYLAELNRAM